MKKILNFKTIPRKKTKNKTRNKIGKCINSKVLTLNDITEEDINKEQNMSSSFNEYTSYKELFSEGQVKLTKFEFQKNHGIEDKFNLLYEEDGIKTEVNGYRGIIKVTVGNDEEIILNYFETLDYFYEKGHEDILYG